MNTDPLFIIGAPRSGTSLVYKALCLHPDAAYISNWLQRYPALPALAALDRLPRRLPTAQHRAWFPSGNAYAYGRRRPLWERVFPDPAEGETVFARAGITTEMVTTRPSPTPAIESLRRAFSSIQRWDGGQVLVVKRIANNRRLRLLDVAFPAARYVEIVRDGRAVALSISRVDWWGPGRLWWLGKSPDEWIAEGGDPLEVSARHWVKEVELIDDASSDIDTSRRLQVRYEDIVDDPTTTLRSIARFAGLGDSADWDRRLDALDFPDRNDRWRTRLEPADLATIERVQGPTLARHGYAIDTHGGATV